MDIRVESVTDNIRVVGDLLELHWEESAKNKAIMILKPDYEKYKQIDAIGKLLGVFGYFEGSIVGYSVNVIDTHLHYSDLIVCSNDVLFLDPVFRDTTLGLRLKKETELAAKDRGAQLMLWHAKENSPFASILAKQKYNVQDIIYSKQL